MTVKMNLPENCFIDKPDLAVMFGNILENAVEACKLVDKDRFITVTGEYTQETAKPAKLSLIVKNNYKIEPHTNEDGVFLSSKHKENGIGISSVNHIAERYGGNCSFVPENGIFTVSVLIFE